ncbi:hypothetical protein AVEN_62811-1 [Araneus ventricosus]|uniref:Uncharacterized protein n=1 Tax=Araneus ventricosus TaxID=182803 RepID=A0A4Y2IFE1_ARAVE|nr:hypothetical protein AVEN_62811-1 [Araneus ventricosus]
MEINKDLEKPTKSYADSETEMRITEDKGIQTTAGLNSETKDTQTISYSSISSPDSLRQRLQMHSHSFWIHHIEKYNKIREQIKFQPTLSTIREVEEKTYAEQFSNKAKITTVSDKDMFANNTNSKYSMSPICNLDIQFMVNFII